MKTIVVIINNTNGRPMTLDQLMKGSASLGYVFSKHTVIFNTKKMAKEICRFHSCVSKDAKYIVLNDKQKECADIIKHENPQYFIKLDEFLNLK